MKEVSTEAGWSALREAMKAKDVNVASLSALLSEHGVAASERTIHSWLQRTRTPPIHKLRVLAEVLGVSASLLIDAS